jgi:hypothetical protein
VIVALRLEYASQHTRATQFGTLVGLFSVLRTGFEEGGLDPYVRQKIYAAADEAIEAFREQEPRPPASVLVEDR